MRVLIISTGFPTLIGCIESLAYHLPKGLREVGSLVRGLRSIGPGKLAANSS